MKTLKNPILFLLATLLLISACGGTNVVLSGTYVNHAAGEFSISDDTLIIEQIKQNAYSIERHTGYQIIDEAGKPGKRLFELEKWKAEYDEDSYSMTERSKGRILSFDPGKGLLKLENSVYQCIN